MRRLMLNGRPRGGGASISRRPAARFPEPSAAGWSDAPGGRSSRPPRRGRCDRSGQLCAMTAIGAARAIGGARGRGGSAGASASAERSRARLPSARARPNRPLGFRLGLDGLLHPARTAASRRTGSPSRTRVSAPRSRRGSAARVRSLSGERGVRRRRLDLFTRRRGRPLSSRLHSCRHGAFRVR